MATSGTAKRSSADLLVYFALAFALTWSAWAWAAETEQPPLLGGLGPILAASLSAIIFSGGRGVQRLFGRLAKWRVSPWLYVLALLWGPALLMCGVAILFLFGFRDFEFPPISKLLFFALPFLLVFATLEEVGWRGYALPRLQIRLNALAASLVLGLIHGLWHLPLFCMVNSGMGPFALDDFLLYMAGIMAGAVILTFLFNSSGGSLLPVILAHASYNVFVHALPFTGTSSQIYEIATVIAAIIAAAVIVWIYGSQRLARSPVSVD